MRLNQPLHIDGALDEALYRDVASISDFIQVEPQGGEAATERTETWIAFDDEYVYVSFRMWDSQMETLIATEMRRDSTNSWQGNDLVSFILNTSQLFVAPFVGIFNNDALKAGGSVLDIAAIAALIGWTLLEAIVIWAVNLMRREPV